MSASSPAAAPPASSDPSVAATSLSSAATDPAASASSASTSSSSTSAAPPSGVSLIPAERNDFYIGAPIYVRQQPATVTIVDWPHVYWRSAGMADDQQKHRSFSDCRDIFSIDERDRGKKGDRPPHLPHSITHALPGLLLSASGGGGGLVDEDEDDEDEDDEEFTVAAVTAVLKPSLAQKAIAVLEERRSPRHSPKNKPSNTAAEESETSDEHTEGKGEESSQLVDSDS